MPYPRKNDGPPPPSVDGAVVAPAAAASWIAEIEDWAAHNDSPWDYEYEVAPVFGASAALDLHDAWGTPRPPRYEWPPHVTYTIHFQLFSGTTAVPTTLAGWNDLLARYTIAQIGGQRLDPNGRVKSWNNYFAHNATRGVGFAFTKAVERLQTNGFGHQKLTRRDKFYGITPALGAAAFGSIKSDTIPEPPAPDNSPVYEMVVTIVDERPDWYPNTSSEYELSPWWKKDHMFAGNHWDLACTTFIADVEALNYRGRVFFDQEITWKRRDSRGRVNTGNFWPYNLDEGGNATVEYQVNDTTLAKTNASAPGPNPIPESSVDRETFVEP